MSKNPSADDLIHVIEVACQKLLLPRDFAATMMSEIRDQDTVKIKLNFCLIPDTPPGMQGKCWDEMRSPDQFSQFISYECIPYVKDECLGIAEFGSTFLIEILRQIYPLIFVLLTEKPESISSVTVYSSDDKEWGRIPVEGWYEAVQCLCDSQWLRDILREDGELAEKVCKASPIRWLVQAFPTFESMKPSEADNPLDGFDFD
ncbi:MAG: hypothetical protein LBC42_02970 [Puniceicoccales bacterium]|nr:hypothetical protein [Puniceicoccales bacterium]